MLQLPQSSEAEEARLHLHLDPPVLESEKPKRMIPRTRSRRPRVPPPRNVPLQLSGALPRKQQKR